MTRMARMGSRFNYTRTFVCRGPKSTSCIVRRMAAGRLRGLASTGEEICYCRLWGGSASLVVSGLAYSGPSIVSESAAAALSLAKCLFYLPVLMAA